MMSIILWLVFYCDRRPVPEVPLIILTSNTMPVTDVIDISDLVITERMTRPFGDIRSHMTDDSIDMIY